MPNATAPNAPCVDVWLSPHAMVMPGLRQAQLRADDVHDALVGARRGRRAGCRTRGSCARAPPSSPRPCRRANGRGWPSVGTMWSTVAKVRSGKATRRPRRRSMSNACGLVTSWTRCRPMNSCVCPVGRRRTVCRSQTFCSSVEPIWIWIVASAQRVRQDQRVLDDATADQVLLDDALEHRRIAVPRTTRPRDRRRRPGPPRRRAGSSPSSAARRRLRRARVRAAAP